MGRLIRLMLSLCYWFLSFLRDIKDENDHKFVISVRYFLVPRGYISERIRVKMVKIINMSYSVNVVFLILIALQLRSIDCKFYSLSIRIRIRTICFIYIFYLLPILLLFLFLCKPNES